MYSDWENENHWQWTSVGYLLWKEIYVYIVVVFSGRMFQVLEKSIYYIQREPHYGHTSNTLTYIWLDLINTPVTLNVRVYGELVWWRLQDIKVVWFLLMVLHWVQRPRCRHLSCSENPMYPLIKHIHGLR